MKNLRMVLWLALLGIGVSAATGLLILRTLPQSWAAAVYLWPGNLAAPILGKIIPTAAVYWLVPEGGAPAYLLLILVGAFASWAALFTLVALAVHRTWLRPNNSFKPKPLRGSA